MVVAAVAVAVVVLLEALDDSICYGRDADDCCCYDGYHYYPSRSHSRSIWMMMMMNMSVAED